MNALTTLACATLIFLPALATAGEADGIVRLSEPVEATDAYEVFGTKVAPIHDPVSLSELIANDEAYQGKEVFVETRVAKVCQKKGCFFIAQDGDKSARVSFKDYGFFVPTDTGGKTVKLVGTFSKKTITEAQAKHFAEDAGEDPSKVTGDRTEYAIVATSVIIPRS